MEDISSEEIKELLSHIETYNLGIKLLEKLGYKFTSIVLGNIETNSFRVLQLMWRKPRYSKCEFLFKCGVRIYNEDCPVASCYVDVWI